MAQTIGDLLSRYAQQAMGAATKGTPIRHVSTQPPVGPPPVTRQSITPVDRGNWFEKQASAPWTGQAGGLAEEGGDMLKKLGGGVWDTLGPDTEAWGDIFSGDASLGDFASAGLDLATFVPGVGMVARTGGKLALKGAVKAAGKEGLGAAAKTAAKGSAIRTPAVQKSLDEMLQGGLKASKNAGKKQPGVVRRQFTDPNLAASKSIRGSKAASKSSPAPLAPGAGAASPFQRGAGNVSSKLLDAQRKMAIGNQHKIVNKALGRNKARLGLTSTSKTSNALKFGAIGARNGIQDLLAAKSGPGADLYEVDFGDGGMQMPGDAMIGYVVGGGGGGGGNVQPMSVAEASAAISAGALQSGGSWVRLS